MRVLCYLIAFLFISSCLSESERKSRNSIRIKYKAEEVRIHFSKEEINNAERKVAEIIIINSALLSQSSFAFEDGIEIAADFYSAMKEKNSLFGIRVIISNPSINSHFSGFAKSYFYEKNLLNGFKFKD